MPVCSYYCAGCGLRLSPEDARAAIQDDGVTFFCSPCAKERGFVSDSASSESSGAIPAMVQGLNSPLPGPARTSARTPAVKGGPKRVVPARPHAAAPPTPVPQASARGTMILAVCAVLAMGAMAAAIFSLRNDGEADRSSARSDAPAPIVSATPTPAAVAPPSSPMLEPAPARTPPAAPGTEAAAPAPMPAPAPVPPFVLPPEPEEEEEVILEPLDLESGGKRAPAAPPTADPPAPADPPAAAGEVVATRKGKKYHKPDCKWAKEIPAKNLVRYDGPKAALAADLEPCGTCKPPR